MVLGKLSVPRRLTNFQVCRHRTDISCISARYRKRDWTDIVLPIIGIESDQYLVGYISV